MAMTNINFFYFKYNNNLGILYNTKTAVVCETLFVGSYQYCSNGF